MCKISPEIWETVIFIFFLIWNTCNHVILVFFRVMATCSDRDDELSSSLVLCIIYTDEGYSDWKPWINDHVVIVLLLLCDDVLIENNKYGYVTMPNYGAMKIVNFTHVQTAETRCSFRPSVNAGYKATLPYDVSPANI